ncbi:P-loop containing nucleoside triphosphate hydrolase protein [Diplogelasinospora grovesii]|uniref:P-loop containing nucleoside triphosphate hydrolase protein n=1 Tax=Diplogelasinospora grovesii TaxID=303347 RepID=A0AAN6S7Z2_9PEZI|nr:P-loop containing nucleoside triphosphate hydrolase protein [Diplogelasinospora grovesii]
MKSLEFRIRKLHVNSETEKKLQKKQPSRVYVNEEALIELTGYKDGGKAVYIEKVSAAADEQPQRREATLWKAPEKLDKAVTQMYDAFRDACGYRLGEQVRVIAAGGSLPDADEVVLEEVAKEGESNGAATPEPISPKDISGWEFFLAGRLNLIEHVYAGLTFNKLLCDGPERSFVVASVNGRSTGNARYIHKKTGVRIAEPAAAITDTNQVNGVAPQTLEVTGIRGLDAQIEKLNDLLGCLSMPSSLREGLPLPGIIIHGGHGTGKTMLLDNMAKSGWGTVHRIQFKDKLSEIQEVFQKAKLQQPSIILIDQLERLIDKERNNRAAVIQAICEAMDGLAAEADLRGEPPRVMVVATCLDFTTDVPADLKEPRRFTSEVYLPVPDVACRREILASLMLRVEPDKEEDLLRSLSERTHAYNGKDLWLLVNEARLIGSTRTRKTTPASTPAPEDASETGEEAPAPQYCLPEDYEKALKIVRPSAMHDVNLKPPPIRFDDIGGQESVKKALRRAVRMSTESTERLSRYFDRPPRGFLLYGPPGCSKTMAAQAMATESGLNFFAVKGAELLNMYVGESERAVRRLFARAREVAPSMIFFDEIDSIGGQRPGFGSSSSSTTSHGGLNVLTTLLNEMDGFEAMEGVVVLAATNRPQALDPALLRPGRIDKVIYVSPPDEEARKAIFRGVAAKRRMNTDVDIDQLARDTEGYSGAEIKGICAHAGEAAYDRDVEEGSSDGIRMSDLQTAIRNQRRQITKEMLRGFEEWEKQFRKD